jgi:hypothetical protein
LHDMLQPLAQGFSDWGGGIRNPLEGRSIILRVNKI